MMTPESKEIDRDARSFVHAGFPSPAEHYIEKPLDLNTLLVTHPDATFFVRAASDAMYRAGIRNGDIMVVDRSIDSFDGAIVVVAVGDEFLVRRQQHTPEGHLILEAAHPNYSPLLIDDLREVRRFGVVTGIVRQLRYVAASVRDLPMEFRSRATPTAPEQVHITRRRQRYDQKITPGGQ